MKFHVESLNKKQFSVLQKLAPIVQQKDFYLGGGTALAIYFGHRVSVDLDWFTSKPIGDMLVFAQSLRKAHLNFVTEQTSPGTLHGVISNLRVTFLEYQYPLLKAPNWWKEVGCSIASPEDLACMKLRSRTTRCSQRFLRYLCAWHKTVFFEGNARFLS